MDVKINNLNLEDISGNKKTGTSILRPYQDKYIQPLVKMVPSWLQTNHLTLMTLGWSAMTLVGAYLFRFNKLFVLLCALSMVGHYLTDFLDGEIGRRRNTGLVFWGFLVDHYLDFVFGCVTVMAIKMVLDIDDYMAMVVMIVVAGSFLLELHTCHLFGKYEVYGHDGIGGIELELLATLSFTAMAFFSRPVMKIWFYIVMFLSTIQLIKQFYRLQKKVWEIDMKNKNNQPK